MTPTIKAKDFLLRQFKKGDETSLRQHINHKDIYRNTLRIPYPYTPKHARDWIKRCVEQEKKKEQKLTSFAIDINGQVVGSVSLSDINQKHKAELGYWLSKKYRNKGIMTQAVKLVSRYGFDKLKLKRIYASVYPKNTASKKVLEKNGYKPEGLLKKNYKKNNKLLDAMLYAKIK